MSFKVAVFKAQKKSFTAGFFVRITLCYITAIRYWSLQCTKDMHLNFLFSLKGRYSLDQLFGMYLPHKKQKEHLPPNILEFIFQQIIKKGVISYQFLKLIPVPRKIFAGPLTAKKKKKKYPCLFLSIEVEAIYKHTPDLSKHPPELDLYQEKKVPEPSSVSFELTSI